MTIAKRINTQGDMDIKDSPKLISAEDILRPDRDFPTNAAPDANDGLHILFAKGELGSEVSTELKSNMNIHTQINMTSAQNVLRPDQLDSLSGAASTVNDARDLKGTTSKDYNNPGATIDIGEVPMLLSKEDMIPPEDYLELARAARSALDLLNERHQAELQGHNTHGSNMDIDDMPDDDPDGGVSLIPLSPPPSYEQSCGSTTGLGLGLGLTITTSLPPPSSPRSSHSTPKASQSPLPTIEEEADPTISSAMDFSFNDTDEIPPLEDTTPSLPGMWPNFTLDKPFQTRYSPSSPSPLRESFSSNSSRTETENPPNLQPRRSSSPDGQKQNPSNGGDTGEIDAAYSDDETPTRDGEQAREEKKEPESVRVEWGNEIWPPQNPYERALCERVCEEVALTHGFQRVYIRSYIITQYRVRSHFSARRIYVEPHLVATFIKFQPPVSQPKQASNWSSIYKNNIKYHFGSQDTDRETKKRVIKKTAEVHVGPDFTRAEEQEELEEGEQPEEREPEEVLSEEEEKVFSDLRHLRCVVRCLT